MAEWPARGNGTSPVSLGRVHDMESKSKMWRSLYDRLRSPPPNTNNLDPISDAECPDRGDGGVPTCAGRYHTLPGTSSMCKSLNVSPFQPLPPPNTTMWLPYMTAVCPDRGDGGVPAGATFLHAHVDVDNIHTQL